MKTVRGPGREAKLDVLPEIYVTLHDHVFVKKGCVAFVPKCWKNMEKPSDSSFSTSMLGCTPMSTQTHLA